MDGLVLIAGFLAGLLVCLCIVYLYSEPEAKEPAMVMTSEQWAKKKFIEDKDYWGDKRDNIHKIQVLEDFWFETHPCEYRIIGGNEAFHETVQTCHYPTPEGGYTWQRDMLSKCAECKVRKESMIDQESDKVD